MKCQVIQAYKLISWDVIFWITVDVSNGVRKRRNRSDSAEEGIDVSDDSKSNDKADALESAARWRRILLLIVAITVHNIPEGLAVGVGFGAVGKSAKATFESARNLAIGIGIQNFPEGLAVSLPLKAAGFSASKAIWFVNTVIVGGKILNWNFYLKQVWPT